MSKGRVVKPLPTTRITECTCCGKAGRAAASALDPICDECDKAREPLLAEIERLKAELAKFQAVVNPYRLVPGGFSSMCKWCPGLPGYPHSDNCPWATVMDGE